MKQQKKPKNKKKIALIAIASLVLAFLVYVFTINISGSTGPIREFADKFQPPSEWQMDAEEIIPPRIVCWESYAGKNCPQLTRSWKFKRFDLTQIKDLLDKTGWNYQLEGRCSEVEIDLKKNKDILCFSHTVSSSYDLYLTFSQIADTEEVQLRMYIHER